MIYGIHVAETVETVVYIWVLDMQEKLIGIHHANNKQILVIMNHGIKGVLFITLKQYTLSKNSSALRWQLSFVS